MEKILRFVKRIIPSWLFKKIQKPYHFSLAFLGAVFYRFPSRKIKVVAVTGTKGKSSTTEILSHILKADNKKVASVSTIQFSIGEKTERNKHKMTMPGRFFIQNFLRKAVDASCTHAIIEMTSEGAKQFRHRFVDIDMLIFTNLSPEHIESHGSFINYKNAKLSIAEAVFKGNKRPRSIVSNVDDEHGNDFLNFEVENKLSFSLKDLTLYSLHKESISLVLEGLTIRVPLIGLFNIYNCLGAITASRSFGVPLDVIHKALQEMPPLRGRVEKFETGDSSTKQITAIVDYAHTPDSLEKLYEAFKNQRKVCVLGNTGGGRDAWKRPEMGAISEKHCEQIILTNEDPYDEDPQKIVEDMEKGMSKNAPVEIILDRREAIKHAIEATPENGFVIISGKGTDPFIMGPNGERQPWSDSEVVQELLKELEKTNDSTAEQGY